MKESRKETYVNAGVTEKRTNRNVVQKQQENGNRTQRNIDDSGRNLDVFDRRPTEPKIFRLTKRKGPKREYFFPFLSGR